MGSDVSIDLSFCESEIYKHCQMFSAGASSMTLADMDRIVKLIINLAIIEKDQHPLSDLPDPLEIIPVEQLESEYGTDEDKIIQLITTYETILGKKINRGLSEVD